MVTKPRVPARLAGAVFLAAVAGCGAGPQDGLAGTGSPAPSSRAPLARPAGAAAGVAGDPCALLTATAVHAATGEVVRAVTRLPVFTDGSGTSQLCVLDTSSPPMMPGGTDFPDLARGLSGMDEPSQPAETVVHLDGGGIGVQLSVVSKPSSLPGIADLPPGSRVVPGVGRLAAVSPGAGPGAIGYVLVGAARVVHVYVLEGRRVPPAQIDALLRAVASRA